jgi:streptogramin lyase
MTKALILCAAVFAVLAWSAAARPPLTFVWPTSIDLQPDGSLVLVENGRGRVLRVQPVTGRTTQIAVGLVKPFQAVRAPSGSIFVSDAGALRRIEGGGSPVTVATANEDIGPVAVARSGAVFYATATRVFRLGTPRAIASGLSGPHGLAVASDGAVLVCDTNHDRVRRIDPRSGSSSTLIKVKQPRGIDIASDGSVFVVEGAAKRIGRFSATGASLGTVGPAFEDPYDVELAANGALYVLDTAAAGTIRRVARNGSVSTVPTG